MLKIDAVRYNAIYLIGDVKLESGKECFFMDTTGSNLYSNESRLFVRETNVPGVFQYGSEQLSEYHEGHYKGYIWSSRASVMNRAFGTKLVEAYYKQDGAVSYVCCAADLVRFEKMLNELGYEVDWEPVEKTECSDLHYRIKKKKEENKND